MIGIICYFGREIPPSGWLACGGQAISRVKYVDLFSVIGTTYGVGDGTTTFNLPDIRGRVIAGPNSMGGNTENRLTGLTGGVSGSAIGNSGGLESCELTAAQVPNLTTLGDCRGTDTGSLAEGTYEGEPAAHNNVQPTIIIPVLIYTGVLD